MRRQTRRAAAVVATGVLIISGCARSADRASNPESSQQSSESQSGSASIGGLTKDIGLVAGKPITDEPSGLRPNAPREIPSVTNTDGGEIDRVTAMSVADIYEFWSGAYGPPLTGKFAPVADLFSWDSTDPNTATMFCGDATAGFSNAEFCGSEDKNCTAAGVCSSSYNTIGWDRGDLVPTEQRAFGDTAIGLVLSHEVGHAIQYLMADLNPRRSIVAEQQADCFAGMYMRWVTDGKSPRFTLNTGEGLNKMMAELLGIRDPTMTQDQRREDLGRGEHGSAFERISAFEMGFSDGTAACAGINEKEIAGRRGALPVALESGESGENPVTEDSLKLLIEALDTLFTPADPPELNFGAQSCSGATSSAPVSYCPSTNTIIADVPALADLTTSISSESGTRPHDLPQFGDYTAYSMVASRYMLALQQQKKLSLDGEKAGLRTACLTGVATAKMATPVTVSGQTIKLTAGDLDEAVAGIVVNGLLAADVNGKSTANGFARVEALRAGVSGDQDTCLKAFA